MEALISVIVPVYNVKKYLEECVNSILRQSYSNLEILLIDDGSTDGSGDLCDELMASDKRIIVFHNENSGLSAARNFGMEHSRGEFYSFIDSDDAIHRDFYKELIQAQQRNDADIVGCDLSLYHDVSELHRLFESDHTTAERRFNTTEALKEYFSPSGNRILYHGLCMKLYKRELFEDLKFETGKLHEDLYITYKLLDTAKTIVYIDCPYYFYFQNNPESICKNYGVKNFLDEAEAFSRIWCYFVERDQLRQELVYFLISHYLLMFEKGYAIRKLRDIKKADKDAKEWVRTHLRECSRYGRVKKVLIRLSLRDIRILIFLKKLRGR